MSSRPFVVFLLFLCVLLCPPGPLQADSLTGKVLQLQNRYRELTSLGFNFIQVTRTGRRSRIGSGKAVFVRTDREKKTGIMRWDYLKPDPQVILNDGRELSIYSAADHQLIVTPAAQFNNDITYRFFTGNGSIEGDFEILPADDRWVFALEGVELTAARLVPRRPHPQIKTVQIWFDNAFLLHRLVMEDHFGSVTQLTFTDIQTNPIAVDDRAAIERILALNLPADTEIIRQ